MQHRRCIHILMQARYLHEQQAEPTRTKSISEAAMIAHLGGLVRREERHLTRPLPLLHVVRHQNANRLLRFENKVSRITKDQDAVNGEQVPSNDSERSTGRTDPLDARVGPGSRSRLTWKRQDAPECRQHINQHYRLCCCWTTFSLRDIARR